MILVPDEKLGVWRDSLLDIHLQEFQAQFEHPLPEQDADIHRLASLFHEQSEDIIGHIHRVAQTQAEQMVTAFDRAVQHLQQANPSAPEAQRAVAFVVRKLQQKSRTLVDRLQLLEQSS